MVGFNDGGGEVADQHPALHLEGDTVRVVGHPDEDVSLVAEDPLVAKLRPHSKGRELSRGRLATIQAPTDGYDEAILLTGSGKVAESAVL